MGSGGPAGTADHVERVRKVRAATGRARESIAKEEGEGDGMVRMEESVGT